MFLNGREVKFRYTVGASVELKKHYDNATEASLAAAYEEDPESALEDMKFMMLTLNKAAVVKSEFESGKPLALHDYSSRLTSEEIDNLTESELNMLVAEMLAAKEKDGATTVETEIEKKTNEQSLN